MTAHSPIDAQAAQMAALRRSMQAALDVAEQMPGGQQVIGEVLCAALDTVGGGAPRHDAFGDMRRDAEWWADMATPQELEIYTAAALKRISRATFAQRAKKRLFMALWGSFTGQERKSFINKVQPKEEQDTCT